MANNYPDGGEQPLGPIERQVLPWLAWLFTTALSGGGVAALVAHVPAVPFWLAIIVGLTVGVPFAAWAIRPWSS